MFRGSTCFLGLGCSVACTGLETLQPTVDGDDGPECVIHRRKTVCIIAYFETESKVRTVESTIEDIFTKDKAEFLKLADGSEVRLDKILSVNDTQFYGHCAN